MKIIASPFPDNMVHGEDVDSVLEHLNDQGLQAIPRPEQQQVSKAFPLSDLMPQKCSDTQINTVFESNEYGRVSFTSKTYAQKFYPNGKYYHTLYEYENECACPYYRNIIIGI